MPGIAGVIFKSREALLESHHAAVMVEAMHHESFYTNGVYREDRLNTGIGWTVRQNSFCDGMPIFSERRDLVLVFYGENFPRSLYRGTTGAKYILQRYEDIGESFLSELNGWFVGVLLDLNQGKLLLFNDRYGMQRLYYHESAEAFYFASEAKCLLRVVPSLRRVNPEALAEFAAFDCVLQEKSLFEGISVLPGGSSWTFDRKGSGRRGQYYRPEMLESTVTLTEKDPSRELKCLVSELLPAYLESAEPVGLSLTGGLDTRLIVAGARDTAGLSAYTFAGERDTFDVRQSRKVAQAVGLDYSVLRLGEDFFAGFPKLAEETVYISDGSLGVSGAHNLYFNRLARNIAPVRLTGLFGSEVLRQGRILPRSVRVDGLWSHDVLGRIEAAEQRGIAQRKGHPLTAALHRDIPWRGHGTLSIERSQVTVRSPFMDNVLVEFLYGVPNAIRESKKVQLEIIQRLNAAVGRILSDHGDASGRNVIVLTAARAALWVLFKADYLYFFEPPAFLLKGESVIAFRQLSRLLFGHQKFEHYGMWFRNVLPDYVADLLRDQKTLERSFFDRDFLRKAVDDHIAGKRDYRNHLDKALTLELIMRTLVERRPAPPTVACLPDTSPIVVSSPLSPNH